jgi:hypothetical protein
MPKPSFGMTEKGTRSSRRVLGVELPNVLFSVKMTAVVSD